MLERFLRYVVVDTQSEPDSTTYPSTVKQLDLSRLLVQELREIGLGDVELTEAGYVFATVPGTVEGAPTVGLIAHVDTAPAASGAGVTPIVRRSWSGEPIRLAGRPVAGARSRRHAGPRRQAGARPRHQRRHDTPRRRRQGRRRDHRHRRTAAAARRRAPGDRPDRLHCRRRGRARNRSLRPRGLRRRPRVHVRRLGARRGRDRVVLRLSARAHDRRRRRPPWIGEGAARERAQADVRRDRRRFPATSSRPRPPTLGRASSIPSGSRGLRRGRRSG